MTREAYRAAVDAAVFDPGFQEKTLARLEALAQEKESVSMKKMPVRAGLIAAALCAALAATASAAMLWLTPGEVAGKVKNGALEAAFASDNAISLQESRTVGDYQVCLMGLVSGEGLDRLNLNHARTCAVLSITSSNDAPISENEAEVTVTPLVAGYSPWEVNAWTLHGGTVSFAENGVLYYLLECDTLEPFADHTVYLAVYPGAHVSPSSEQFSFSDEGDIQFREGQEGVLFELPLDASKADPVKARAILGEE